MRDNITVDSNITNNEISNGSYEIFNGDKMAGDATIRSGAAMTMSRATVRLGTAMAESMRVIKDYYRQYVTRVKNQQSDISTGSRLSRG